MFIEDKLTTSERVWKFSARARAYILAYLPLDQEGDTTSFGSIVMKIEKMVNQFKSHRCTLDFNSRFIKSIVIYDN